VKVVDTQQLKSLTTDDTFIRNEKMEKKREAQNVANFVFVSNNMAPFKVEVDDRRYVFLQCQMPEEGAVFFDRLFKSFEHPLFYDTLFSYLMNVDVPVDYDFVHTLPSTELKLATQELYKSPFEEFITKFHERFVEGWSSTQCLETGLKANSMMAVEAILRSSSRWS
jgi:hypothetical protein